MRWVPGTLFGKTAVALMVAFLYFAFFAFAAVVHYVQVPVARQAAEDLATFLLLTGRAWSSLPPADREHYAAEVLRGHDVAVSDASVPLLERPAYRPFPALVEAAVQARTRAPTALRMSTAQDGRRWYWLEMNEPAGGVRVGFPENRTGTHVPTALISVLAASAGLVLVTAMTLASRISRPLDKKSCCLVRHDLLHDRIREDLSRRDDRDSRRIQIHKLRRYLSDRILKRCALRIGIHRLADEQHSPDRVRKFRFQTF